MKKTKYVNKSKTPKWAFFYSGFFLKLGGHVIELSLTKLKFHWWLAKLSQCPPMPLLC